MIGCIAILIRRVRQEAPNMDCTYLFTNTLTEDIRKADYTVDCFPYFDKYKAYKTQINQQFIQEII